MTPAESAERSYLLARLADVTAERDALAAQVQQTYDAMLRTQRWALDELVTDDGFAQAVVLQTIAHVNAALADAPGTEDA